MALKTARENQKLFDFFGRGVSSFNALTRTSGGIKTARENQKLFEFLVFSLDEGFFENVSFLT
jgi:hypothetical protein